MSAACTTRVIAFIDIDAFECQVYQRDYPQYRNTPFVVATSGGRILSATYEAKAAGVSRSTTPKVRDAKKICPNLQVFYKPDIFGKQDTSKTRRATWELLECIKEYCSKFGEDIIIELASSDELYLDISAEVTRGIDKRTTKGFKHFKSLNIPGNIVWESRKCSYVGPFQHNLLRPEMWTRQGKEYHERKEEERLAFGALFLHQLCAHIQEKTHLSSSGGVGNNKLLSKIGCGLNKPGKITICTGSSVNRISTMISISDIPGLGGQLGQKLMDTFKIAKMSQIRYLPFAKLEAEFEKDKSQNIKSWAEGKDNQPVIPQTMKDKITCHKPSSVPVIKNMEKLLHIFNNLSKELQQYLEQEAEWYKRVCTSIRIDFNFILMGDGNPKNNGSETEHFSTTFDRKDEKFDMLKLPGRILEILKSYPKFDINCFEIIDISFTGKDFELSEIDGIQESLNRLLTLNTAVPNTLRVFTKPNNSVVKPSFHCFKTIGSFRTTCEGNYCSKDVQLSKLLPTDKLESLIGTDLGAGYSVAKPRLFYQFSYCELKHKCFVEWLQESKYFEKVKSKEFQIADFISFHGRIADPMMTPLLSKEFGNWEIYGMNIRNVIFLWDEKKSQDKIMSNNSYFGKHFEELVSHQSNNRIRIHEQNLVYLATESSLGKHNLLILNNVDGEDENGDLVQVSLFKQKCRPHGNSFRNFRQLNLWTQAVVSGAKRVVLGKRSDSGILKSVKNMSTEEFGSELMEKGDPELCQEFQSRLLDWIKLHLPEHNPKLVKKFSWVVGKINVISELVLEQEVPKLVIPRLYSSFFEDIPPE